MIRQIKRWGLAFGMVAFFAAGGYAAQPQATQGNVGDGLIDVLVKKGVLSYQEAEDIRTNMQNEYQSTAGGFLTVGSPAVTGLRLYGDVRLRYQWNNIQTMNGSNSDHDQSRYRYRVRVGADYTFAQDWKAGVRLETSTKSDSTNVDFGGYSSKDNAGVYVGLAYLEYETNKPMLFNCSFADYFDFRIGKQLQPFFLPDMLWDPDVNPEGASQQIGWKNTFTEGLDITLRAGEFITSNVNEDKGPSSLVGSDEFLFVAQSEFKYNIGKDSVFTIAPTYIKETNGLASSANQDGNAVFDKQNNIPIVGRIDVLAIPAQFTWKMWNLPNRAYGTWGFNASANDLAKALGMKNGSGNQFFNVGYQLGKADKKGTWQVSAEWRYIEACSYTTWLQDSDWAANYQNQQGPAVSAKYAITDNISAGLTWYHSMPIKNNNSVTAVNGVTANGSNNIGVTDVVQMDLNWKF